MTANVKLAEQYEVARRAKECAEGSEGDLLHATAREEAAKAEAMRKALAKSFGKGGLRIEPAAPEKMALPGPGPGTDRVAALRTVFVNAAIRAHRSNDDADITRAQVAEGDYDRARDPLRKPEPGGPRRPPIPHPARVTLGLETRESYKYIPPPPEPLNPSAELREARSRMDRLEKRSSAGWGRWGGLGLGTPYVGCECLHTVGPAAAGF